YWKVLDPISGTRRLDQSFRFIERRLRHRRKSRDHFATHQLHRAGVIRGNAEEDSRNEIEEPRYEVAHDAVMFAAATGDDDVVVARERQHVEEDACFPLPIGRVEKHEFLARFCIEMLERMPNTAI